MQRDAWEKQLWSIPRDWNWAVLASEKRDGNRRHTPEHFEKVYFIDNECTDTEATVWRRRKLAVEDTRSIAVAFRGTEVSKLTDLFTGVNLAPSLRKRKAFGSYRLAGRSPEYTPAFWMHMQASEIAFSVFLMACLL